VSVSGRGDARGAVAAANGFGSDLQPGMADRRDGLFGGKGEVLVWDLLRGAPAPPFSAVLACELAPGGNVGMHAQQRDPEILICLAGAGTAEVEGRPRTLRPGTVVHLPFGRTLALRNDSSVEPLRYLIIKATET
jgi:quercetin dioxygenase-like cupin family protein